MTAASQRSGAAPIALVLAAAPATAILLVAHAGDAWRAGLVAASSALVAVSVLVLTDAVVGRRGRLFVAAGIAAYGAVAAADAGGAALTARHQLVGAIAFLFALAVVTATTRAWRPQPLGEVGILGLDAVIAGLAVALVGGLLVSAPYTSMSADRVALADAELFAAGYVVAAGAAANWPPSRHALLAGAGLIALGVADAAFGSQLAAGHLRPSRLVVAAWPVGLAAYGMALRQVPPGSRPAPTAVRIALPTLAGAVSLVVMATRSAGSPNGIAAAALVLAGARLSVSLVENMRLVEGTNRSAARQEAIAVLGRQALEGAALEELMVQGMKLAHRLTGAHAACFGEVSPEGLLRFRAGVGFAELLGRDLSGQWVFGGEALKAIARSPDAVLIADWRSERRFPPSKITTETGARSAIGVTVPGPEGLAWALIVICRRPRAFDQADRAFLQAMANVLAAAGERLATETEIRDLAAARERLVTEALDAEQRERRRISEALHRSALQELLTAGQDLDDALAAAGPASGRVALARAGVARAAGDLRDAVAELHPVVLEHAGLGPAIEAIAQRQAARAGFAYELDVDEAAAGTHADVLFALTRELLANVARHSQARCVRVSVRACETGVDLEVTDDGRGVDPARLAAATAGGHIGIASWTARVEALGGTLTVRPGEERGTVARVALPPQLPS